MIILDEWTTPAEWDPSIILDAGEARRRVGNPGTRSKKRRILDIPAAFDIETSHTPGRLDAHLYHWQLQIGLETPTIHGRTWDDFRAMLARLTETIDDRSTLVIYVHNLSFEWQHLRTVYDFTNEELFCTGDRKILRAYMYDRKIELRCSYLLTNMSLSAWTKRMNVAHPKLDSDKYDHDKVRYPWDELSEEELRYCRHDVLGLCEALIAQMARDGDNLAKIPLTSTGYCRRECKAAMQRWSRRALYKIQPDPECYRALREEFRGGDTHCNRYFTGQILENVGSYDRSSSYPDVLVNCRYPMSSWSRWTRLSVKELRRLQKLDMALLMRVRITGLRLRDPTLGDPPLSFSKCRRVINYRLDNGRILCAECLETTINDVDLTVYQDAYVWQDMEILAGWYSSYDFLPDPLRQLVIMHYTRKTELKGTGQDLYYNLAKALVNAFYGMMVQDVTKQDVIFNGVDFDLGEEDLEGKLEAHRRTAFLSYAWGTWCTAWARLRLWEGIKAAGRNYVYGDTDSIKFIGNLDLSSYNAERIRDSKANGAYATDVNGVTHYMGVFEDETASGRYREFCSWGAKKYCHVTHDGQLKITVAGVGKKAGAEELLAAGGMDAFKPGFVFYAAGGTESRYNDLTREVINIDGHDLELGPNIYIRPTTKTLGITPEYAELTADPESWMELLADASIFADFEHEFN